MEGEEKALHCTQNATELQPLRVVYGKAVNFVVTAGIAGEY